MIMAFISFLESVVSNGPYMAVLFFIVLFVSMFKDISYIKKDIAKLDSKVDKNTLKLEAKIDKILTKQPL